MTPLLARGVNAGRLLDALDRLATIGATSSGGVTRLAFTDADLAARREVMAMMQAAGLMVTVDAAGNLLGLPPGAGHRPVLLMGSHLDSVPDGGRFDGTYGVLAAIEVVRALGEQGTRLSRPVGVVAFADEEGTCFPRGLWGSRAVVGDVSAEELAILSSADRRSRFELAGGRPHRLDEARWSPGAVAAYLELHVEQGPVLESVGAAVGVVDGITGRLNLDIVVEGQAGHAGTLPMRSRRDALVAGAEMVLAVRSLGHEVVGSATVGDLDVRDASRNVVPGSVRLVAELRDLSVTGLRNGAAALQHQADRIATTHGVGIEVHQVGISPPARCHLLVREVVAEAAERLHLPSVSLHSAAGHDAQVVARLAPSGMIFVPSAGGVSHAPEEYTDPDALVAGAETLLHAVSACDRRLVG